MGEGITLKCPWCGKEMDISLGKGRPEVKNVLEEDVKKGLFGEKYQELLSKYPFPEGTFENEMVLCYCKKCGSWHVNWNLNFYRKDLEVTGDRVFKYIHRRKLLPSDPYGDSIDHVTWYVYRIYKRYYPICEKCGSRMKMYHELAEIPNDLKCMRCEKEIDVKKNSIKFLWD